MATEKTGNLAEVRDALAPVQTIREQQRYPYKAWYAVIIRSSREQDAADGFRREGVLAYWPNYERHVPIARDRNGHKGRRMVFSAIIPGFIFCPTAEANEFWRIIEHVPGVLNMLRGAGGEIATLTNADIEIIRHIEAGLNLPPPVTPVHNFKTGKKVRFIDDLMGRWPPGKIVRLARDGRISVEIYLMGRMVPIVVLPHQIEAM